MFMGVTAYSSVPSVDSYEKAEAVLARCSRTPTGRKRAPGGMGEFPLGMTKRGSTSVRRLENGAIAFRLYETDVVTWNEDNSVNIQNFGTVTTTRFADHFLPDGIRLTHPSREGGHAMIHYKAAGDEGWDRHVCKGGDVRMMRQGDGWAPDEETIDEMIFLELDRTLARRLLAPLHLKDFAAWLSMAPNHMHVDWQSFDSDACADALRERDFREAARLLPSIEIPRGFGLADRIKPRNIKTPYRDRVITMASIDRLKLALWEDWGALLHVKHKTLPVKQFDRYMRRIRQLSGMGVHTYGLGPRR